MRKAVAVIFLLCAVPTLARNKYDSLPARPPQGAVQQPTVAPPPPIIPFDPTGLMATVGSLVTWSAWSQKTSIDIGSVVDGLTAHQQGQDVSIQSLQGQISDLRSQLSILQAQVAALGKPSTITTIDFSTLPDGPVVSQIQGVSFLPGFWVIKSGQLVAAADSQPQRSITFPKPVTITGVTFTTNTTTTTGIKLTNQAGVVATANAGPVGQPVTWAPGWSAAVTSFTVTSSAGNAPDLGIEKISFTQ